MSNFHNQTAQLIATIAQNLPGMSSNIMQGWIENPKALQKFLLGLNGPVPEFKVWKTIKLGTDLKTAYDFRRVLKDNGFKMDDYVFDILSNPDFTKMATKETEIDLFNVSVADLGFEREATREQIHIRAKKHGLTICPAEVGPQLRLQYKDQPNGECLHIAMEQVIGINGSASYTSLFKVESDSGLYLSCYSASPACVWSANSRFVFSRRK